MSWTLTKRTYSERVRRRSWRVVTSGGISDLANASVCVA